MSEVVAALFDSEADAGRAMDRLNRENMKDLDTRVINGSDRSGTQRLSEAVPFIPMTSGGPSQQGGVGPAVVGDSFGGWWNDMDEVERNFYEDAMREGSTLALAKVGNEEDARRVQLIFKTFGARTHTND